MRRARPFGIASLIPMAAAQFAVAAACAQDVTTQNIDGDDNIAVQGVRDSIITIIQGIDLATPAALVLLCALIILVIDRYLSLSDADILLVLNSKRLGDRKWLKDMLGGASPFIRYKLTIRAFNEKLEGWFGPRGSWRAFARCLQLSFAYPVILFLLTWQVSGQATIGSVPGFEETSGFLDRLWRFAVIGAGAFAIYFGFSKSGSIATAIIRGLNRGLKYEDSTTPLTVRIVGGVVAVATDFAGIGAFAVALAVAADFAVAGAVVGAVAGALSFYAVAVDRPVDGAVAVAIAFVGGFTVVFTFVGVFFAYAVVVAALIFYLVLPIFNAMLDWISWRVTRYFLVKAANAKAAYVGTLLLCLELFADFIAAVFLLVLLAFLIPAGIELLNLLLTWGRGEAVRWTANLETAIRDPWGAGLFVSGMLITTLIPTILHLVAGLAGIFFAWSPESRALRAQVPYEAEKSEQEEMDAVLKVKLKRHFRHQRLWYIPAVPAVGLAIFGIFGLFSVAFEPFSQVLHDAAYCGGALVNSTHGDSCPWW